MIDEKVVKHKVFIDFKSALLKLEREKGIKKTLTSIANESGFHLVTINQLGKKAPDVLGLIYNFLKDYNLDFFDLVKEVQNFEKQE